MKPLRLRCRTLLAGVLTAGALVPISLTGLTQVDVLSPDQAVRFRASSEGGRLEYTISFGARTVIETSPLAMLVDGANLGRDIELGEVQRQRVRESFPWRGVHAWATNHCETAIIPVRQLRGGLRYTLEVRCFNDGAAWRCLIPGGGERRRVPDEATVFAIPSGSTVWYHGLGGHYEDVHRRRAVADIPAGEWAAPPLTFRLPNDTGYACITEAALVHYSGMALQADGRGGFQLMLGHKHPISYPFRLRYSNDVERVSQPASVSGAIVTPWRVVMVGRDLNTLVNSDLIPSLCPPPDPKLFPEGMHTPWIKPGRAVWKYHDGGQNTFEDMKAFSAWAGELGFEYHVIEGFWSRWSEAQIKELVDYSRQRGVGLWFWKHSRDLRTPQARADFFRKLSEWGVVGAKIDFFDHEHREVIDLYAALLEEAARHHILVNFHGANKPSGEARTWPNELVREGVRGMESSRLKERAQHDVTLPFTRFLAGPADYTPVHFGARRGDTTWAHQIASAAVFTAPLLTYAAHPATLLTNAGVEMIRNIPATWDETRVLEPSAIGEVAVFARRRGAEWFLAILNGPEARTFKVPLSFLGEGRCQALLIADPPDNPAALRVEKTEVNRDEAMPVKLSPGGGFIARFTPLGKH